MAVAAQVSCAVVYAVVGEVLSVPGVAKTHKDFKADLYHKTDLLMQLTASS